jgi:hypothetical protein
MDDTPRTISDAFASLNADNWKEVICNEMDAILFNET